MDCRRTRRPLSMNNLCGIRVSRTKRTTIQKKKTLRNVAMNEGRGSEFPMRRMRRMTLPIGPGGKLALPPKAYFPGNAIRVLRGIRLTRKNTNFGKTLHSGVPGRRRFGVEEEKEEDANRSTGKEYT
eukprot:scaffold98460_cov50-Attheya_sp.AAC.3